MKRGDWRLSIADALKKWSKRSGCSLSRLCKLLDIPLDITKVGTKELSGLISKMKTHRLEKYEKWGANGFEGFHFELVEDKGSTNDNGNA